MPGRQAWPATPASQPLRRRPRRPRAAAAAALRLGQCLGRVPPHGDPQHALDGAPDAIGPHQQGGVGRCQRAGPRQLLQRDPGGLDRAGGGWSAACASCRTCAMNSTSIWPPARSFTSHGPSAGRSRSIRTRMAVGIGAQFRRVTGCRDGVGDRGLDLAAQRRRPGDDARAGQRHALPGPGAFGVVAAERAERDRDRAFVAGRPQPHVHGVQRTVRARRGEGRDIGVRGADEPLARGQRPDRTRGGGPAAFRHGVRVVVDQHQVEVGSGHHLPPAGLAHGDDDHAAAAHLAEAAGEVRQHRRQQRGQRRVGQRAASLARRRRRRGGRPAWRPTR